MYLLIGLLGLLAIIAPYVLGYAADSIALWTSLIVGGILLISSIWEGFAADREKWEYWLAGLAGVGAILSPFVLGFAGISSALWTLLIIGVIAVVAAWRKLYPGRTILR